MAAGSATTASSEDRLDARPRHRSDTAGGAAPVESPCGLITLDFLACPQPRRRAFAFTERTAVGAFLDLNGCPNATRRGRVVGAFAGAASLRRDRGDPRRRWCRRCGDEESARVRACSSCRARPRGAVFPGVDISPTTSFQVIST
ncbi:hypothetical protein ACU686_28130, partial [Yinghuangia aomiensis]